jgi:hypothetical protein
VEPRTPAQRALVRAAVAAALLAVLFVAFGLVAGDGR